MNFPKSMGRALAAASLALLGLTAWAEDPASLKAKHAELQEALRSNPYQRAMHIDSAEGDKSLRGDVYAVLDHPFNEVNEALREPGHWCDIMLLPFNTKYCHVVPSADGAKLSVRIGRKYDQPVEQAFRIDFAFRTVTSSPEFLEMRLAATEGPVDTRDYRITLAAIPLQGGKTFMHMSYAYGFGTAGKIAMSAYLATVGSDRVGFSVTGQGGGGQPQYIGGIRGAIERNAMQGGLFDMGAGAQGDTSHYVEVPRWSERERLMNEKPALGFFLSGHPYHAYAAEIGAFVKLAQAPLDEGTSTENAISNSRRDLDQP